MKRYTVVEAKRWRHTSGKTASIFGSVPYTNEQDKQNWSIETTGYTIKDNVTECTGLGKYTMQLEDAIALCNKLNNRSN